MDIRPRCDRTFSSALVAATSGEVPYARRRSPHSLLHAPETWLHLQRERGRGARNGAGVRRKRRPPLQARTPRSGETPDSVARSRASMSTPAAKPFPAWRPRSRAYGVYLVGLLTLLNFVNYLDRMVVVTMYDDLRRVFGF